ncbi:MAG TPA: hypothetical protein ENI19_03250 [Candidatus Nealsonbacteria bacterium]|uniref:Uncharacterized protein n=1 Tax=marine sediment metagenome TaxID=412755 RepID=A0A0F9XT51_9ZZZZ|nr:hypothetical protein [Candidatus Nealsonbacteria bacterium]HEB46696.1 hypothetical protein [Candidatus Nealsonbacteria bacterium]
MPFIAQGKINLKYVLTIVILAVIIGGGILAYQSWLVPREEVETPEVKPPEGVGPEETEVSSTKEETPNGLISTMFGEVIERFGSEDCKQKGKEGLTNQDYGFDSERIDLNSDGIEEFIFTPGWICGESIRGASGNGPFFIYQKINDSWISIGGDIWGMDYEVEDSKTDGHRDISTFARMGYQEHSDMFWRWQKSELKYKEISPEG